MTIEQKAAAYDAAIKRVENIKTGKCETTFVFTEGLFEHIFPELKESEGEKVRRVLREIVLQWKNGHQAWCSDDKEIDTILAWLEKQGEQKPAENKGMNLVEEEMTPFQKKVFCIIDTTIEEEQGLKQVCDELLTLASNEIKQKPTTEIKSAEESLGIDSDTYSKIVDECIYGEQKPAETEKGAKGNEREIPFSGQEWSEEDEDIKDTIIHDLKRLGGDIVNVKPAYKAEIDWLKSLKERVQPQDTAYYNPYKEVVESTAEMCTHYDKASHSGLRDFYDNVKVKCKDAKEYDSLFPQSTWKPSDEQIGVIEAVINNRSFQRRHLDSLYADLKRLSEE